MSDVTTFDPYEFSSEYSPMGVNVGNPMANLILSGLVGRNYMPRPQTGQSMYDALIQRERSSQFMGLQSSMFSNNKMFQLMGLSGNPATRMLGSFAGSPNGALARMMSPILGGNPMAAAMQTYAGFSGANVMGNFGRMTGISREETEGVMQSLAENFYQTKQYEGRGGVKEQHQADIKKFIQDRLAQGPEGKEYLKTAGLRLEKTSFSKESLSPERVNKIAEDMGDENSELSRNLRNRSINKKLKSNDLLNALDTVLNENDESKQKDLKEALVKRLQTEKAASKETIAKFKDKKTSRQGADELRGELEDLGAPDYFETKSLAMQRDKIAGGRFAGFNANTRGFKLEDFTSGFYKAAEMRMLGDSRGKSIAGAMGDFTKNAGGAMSAARSLFGNDKSGSELVEQMNQLVGSTEVDLGSAKGAGEMEDLLRRTKSTARVAGVSIKTMLGIINSAKELAANNPQLQHLNSAATTNIALAAVKKAADLGTVMSGQEYRAAGGSQGISSRDVTETMSFTESNLGGGLGALLLTAKGKGGAEGKAYQQLQSLIQSGKITGSYLENGGMEEISRMLGTTTGEAKRIFSDEFMKRAASEDKGIMDTVSQASDSVVMETFFTGMEKQGLGSQAQLERNFKEHIARGGSAKSFLGLLSSQTTQGGKDLIQKYQGKIQAHFLGADRSEESKRAMDKLITDQTEQEKLVSAKMDKFTGPAITNIIDAMAKSGKIDLNSAAEAIGTTFATKDTNGNEIQNPYVRDKLEKAQAAGLDLARITSRGKGQEDALKEGLGKNLNAVLSAMSLTQGGLRTDFKDEELKASAAFAKSLGSMSADEAERTRQDLQQQKEDKERVGKKLDADSEKTLVGLTREKELGHLISDSALNLAKKGTVQSGAAATLEGYRVTQARAAVSELKDKAVTDMGEQLQLLAKSTVTDGSLSNNAQVVQDLLASKEYAQFEEKDQQGKGTGRLSKEGYSKILQDFQGNGGRGQGSYFGNAEKRRQFEETSTVGQLLHSTQDKINQAEAAATAGGKTPEDTTQKDLLEALKTLTSAVTGENGISKAIGDLARNLLMPGFGN